MMPLLESPPAQRLAWTLLHFLWQGTLLGLAAWAAFALLRHQRPHLRYLVGCACLLACLGCAVGTYAALSPAARSAGAAMDLPQVAEWIQTGQTAVLEVRPSVLSLPWQARLEPFLPWILALWASGVVALSLRTMGGWLWLRRLRVSAAPISEPVWLEGLLRNAGLSRTVRFLESVRVVTPLCMGLLRPVILLPLGFFANLDPLAAEAVLAHELAHIKRMDGLVNGLQCVVEVLFFFHPAVWWISRRIRAEREHCCDDAAVLACGDVILYAETLSRLDELRDRPLSLALQARGGNLMERMRRLLLSDTPQFRFSTPSLTLLAALVLTLSLPAQAEKPKGLPTGAGEKSATSLTPTQEPPRADLTIGRVPAPTSPAVPTPGLAPDPQPTPELPSLPRHESLPAAELPPPSALTQSTQVPPPVRITERPTLAQSGVSSTKTQGGLPVLKRMDLPIATGTRAGFVLLPSFSSVIEDEITEGRERLYAVKVPAKASIRVQAHSDSGGAHLRLKAYGRGSVYAKGPVLPEVTFQNNGDKEVWFSFTVGFDKSYPGERRITLRETVSGALSSREPKPSASPVSERPESPSDSSLEESLPQTTLDLGPKPSLAEALAFVQIMADQALWGPKTLIQDVKVDRQARWYANLTNRWPKGRVEGPTIEGWEITFSAKPNTVLAPYSSFRRKAILVDRDRVVYWRTHTQWDTHQNILPNSK